MFILGLQGSPRAKGNTSIILSTFLKEAESLGAHTEYLSVCKKKITPCQECGVCEKAGFCPIDDDMQDIYPLFRRADIIVMATPVFFYGPTAQIKALIDRSQALWSRRYRMKLSDPGKEWRQGFMLAVGATKGKNLFDGLDLTAKYFFDAVSADYKGYLGYRQIEKAGEIKKHPDILSEIKEKANALITPFLNRKKILFICRENACRSQMAAALTKKIAGDRIKAVSAGSKPAQRVNSVMLKVMEEKNIDIAFYKPESIEEATRHESPDLVISMGCGDKCPAFAKAEKIEWDIEDPAGKSVDFMRKIRDEIEEKIKEL